MKKFCIILAVLGLVLTSAGIAIAAVFGRYSDDVSRILDDNSAAEYAETTFETTITEVSGYFEEVTVTDGGRIYHNYNNNTEINGIKINAYAADITISKSYDEFVSVDCQNVDAKYYVEGITDGILEITYKPDNVMNLKDLIDYDEPEIYIYIPEAASVDLSLNAGDIDIYDMTMNNLTVRSDAGEIYIGNSVVTDSSDLHITAGEIQISSCKLNNTAINKTAGTVSVYDSVMTGATKLDSTAGGCYFEISGDISDYYFKLDVTAGDVIINDSPSVPDGNSASAPNSFYITQTAGDCDISIN